MDYDLYEKTIEKINKYNIPHMVVINKIDSISEDQISKIEKHIKNPVFVSSKNMDSILNLKDKIIESLNTKLNEETILGNLLMPNSKIIMVVPIDSEAPKGRLILPQVQLLRDCLDHGIKSYVVRDTELESALLDIKDVDLVVTDSAAFKKVSQIVPNHIKLTSFSILLANQRGDIKTFIKGTDKIKSLDESSKILVSESCSHNYSHEDIGRVKIPTMLNKLLNKDLNYDFKMAADFPEDIEKYDLIIHCGACMVNKKSMNSKIMLCKEKNIPITNYGIILAYLTGILDRSTEIFNLE